MSKNNNLRYADFAKSNKSKISQDASAGIFGKYHFNDHGVCINPDIVFSFKTKRLYCTLKVCETKEGFSYGYDYGVNGNAVGCGGSSGAPSLTSTMFAKREMAILQAAQNARRYFVERKNLPVKEYEPLKKFIESITSGEIQPTKEKGFYYGWVNPVNKKLSYVKQSFPLLLTTIKNDAKFFSTLEDIKSEWLIGKEDPKNAMLALTSGSIDFFDQDFKKIPFPKEWKQNITLTNAGESIIKEPAASIIKKQLSSSTKNKTKMLQSELQVVLLNKISTTPSNQLLREPWELEESALKELADSIKEKDVIQPIVLRPNDKPGLYILVCGERRFHASLLAGKKDIPAVIKNLTEEEAFDLQITENLQRKDVHPMKEASAYKALMDASPEKNTVAELAHRFGKSTEYITQRLSFNNLIPEMRKEFAAGKMLIGHALLFSRLQEDDQRDCMVNCKPKYGPSVDQYEPVKTVETYIMQKLVREIKKACFNENDKELVAAAGSCNDCNKRSGNNELFSDIKEKDRCFDGACYQLKTATHLINQMAELVKDNPNMAVIISGYGNKPLSLVKKWMTKNKVAAYNEYEYESAAKSDKGAVKALIVAGPDIGETRYVRIKKSAEEKPVSSVKGTAAKDSPAHYDELIAQEKQLLKDREKNILEDVHEDMVERAKTLKPYIEPDLTPLDKYELAVFYMHLNSQIYAKSERKVESIIKKIPVDKGLSKDEQLVEQWAKAPQEVINYLIRSYITEADIESLNFPAGIAFRKAVGGWKGLNLDAAQKEAAGKIEKAKVESQKRIEELQAKKKELNKKK